MRFGRDNVAKRVGMPVVPTDSQLQLSNRTLLYKPQYRVRVLPRWMVENRLRLVPLTSVDTLRMSECICDVPMASRISSSHVSWRPALQDVIHPNLCTETTLKGKAPQSTFGTLGTLIASWDCALLLRVYHKQPHYNLTGNFAKAP